jgi:hypothetical protein
MGPQGSAGVPMDGEHLMEKALLRQTVLLKLARSTPYVQIMSQRPTVVILSRKATSRHVLRVNNLQSYPSKQVSQLFSNVALLHAADFLRSVLRMKLIRLIFPRSVQNGARAYALPIC